MGLVVDASGTSVQHPSGPSSLSASVMDSSVRSADIPHQAPFSESLCFADFEISLKLWKSAEVKLFAIHMDTGVKIPGDSLQITQTGASV